jgi:hypothetical protein
MIVADHARLDYILTLAGPLSPTDMLAEMSAPPTPTQELGLLGCFVSSDLTTHIGGTIRRRILVAIAPDVDATATAAIDGGSKSAPIQSLTLTAGGSGYTVPPVVVFGDSSGTAPTKTAQAVALLGVLSAAIQTAGSSDFTTATVAFVGGGLEPGGTPATATATIVGGAVTALVITGHGSGYRTVPTVVVTGDGTVSPIFVATLEVVGLTLTNPGEGYTTPTVFLQGVFKYTWPDGNNFADQRQPFYNLMKQTLQSATSGPVVALAPVMVP